jgi:hypothetical protein
MRALGGSCVIPGEWSGTWDPNRVSNEAWIPATVPPRKRGAGMTLGNPAGHPE